MLDFVHILLFVVFILTWICFQHPTLFYLFINTYIGRFSLICLVIAATTANIILGLLLALLFMVSDINFRKPNEIVLQSIPHIVNFSDLNRSILKNKIKFENYVLIKPFQTPLEFQKVSNSKILPFY